MRKGLVILIGLLVILLIGVVVVIKPGQFLQTRALGDPGLTVGDEFNAYEKIEAYCTEIKNAHTHYCEAAGLVSAQQCSESEGERIYGDCMQETTFNDEEYLLYLAAQQADE